MILTKRNVDADADFGADIVLNLALTHQAPTFFFLNDGYVLQKIYILTKKIYINRTKKQRLFINVHLFTRFFWCRCQSW
jgi:uncharacterized membrane protein